MTVAETCSLCRKLIDPFQYSYLCVCCLNNQFLSPLGTTCLHNRLICRHNIDYVNNDENNRTTIIVLAKHWIAPWWWFLREPKHVGVTIGILTVLTFLWFIIVCFSWNNRNCFEIISFTVFMRKQRKLAFTNCTETMTDQTFQSCYTVFIFPYSFVIVTS
jgi:hypothetical protein